MSNVVYFDDFRQVDIDLSPLTFEERYFPHVSANTNEQILTDPEKELTLLINDLINDINISINQYLNYLNSIDDINELIDKLQKAFVFLNKETKYD